MKGSADEVTKFEDKLHMSIFDRNICIVIIIIGDADGKTERDQVSLDSPNTADISPSPVFSRKGPPCTTKRLDLQGGAASLGQQTTRLRQMAQSAIQVQNKSSGLLGVVGCAKCP